MSSSTARQAADVTPVGEAIRPGRFLKRECRARRAATYPELAYPELAYPELAYPELAYPELAYPELAYPELAPGSRAR
jgi:hypothetical protein